MRSNCGIGFLMATNTGGQPIGVNHSEVLLHEGQEGR